MNIIELTPKDEKVFEKLNSLGALGKRAVFIFQYLFLREDFRKMVLVVREKMGIPKDGFDIKEEESSKLVYEKYLDHGCFTGEIIINPKIKLDSEGSNLVENYMEQSGIDNFVPNMDLADGFIKSIINEYVVLNGFIGLFRGSFAMATVETYGGMKSEEDDRDAVELRFSIPISAKKEEIKEYIDTVWDNINHFRGDILTAKDEVRFRPKTHFIRDIKILNKYIEIENMSSAQRKEKGIQYIEIAVKKQLQADGLKDIPDEGTIRSIVSRLKNEIKDKSAFWRELEPPIEHSATEDFGEF